MKDGLIEHDSDIDEDHLKMRENLLNSKRKTSNILEPPNSANNNMKSNNSEVDIMSQSSYIQKEMDNFFS